MKLNIDTRPARAAGKHISDLINGCSVDSVVLLAGGSAFDVFEFINIPDKSECRTIFIMGDERVTGKVDENNYLQLQAKYADHPLFEYVLDTSASVDETPEIFAARVKDTFLENISKLSTPKVFSLLGVGSDGHTAGIFPMSEESFAETYPSDSTYVPVHIENLTIDSRASFTPSWILHSSDALIGYVTGGVKKQILNDLINESMKLHERPAELLKRHKNSFIYTDIGS